MIHPERLTHLAGGPTMGGRGSGMPSIARGRFRAAAALLLGAMLSMPAWSTLVVTLDVPLVPSAGSALGFEFVAFQFDVSLVGLGDPGASDYAANVIASGHERYTYLHRPPCGGGGLGGSCNPPPPYVRIGGISNASTYQSVTSPPTELQAFFHFSGADVVGLPMSIVVQHAGQHSITLTDDATGAPVAAGTPLSGGHYTLEYQSNDTLAGRVTLTSAVAEPAVAPMLLTGALLLAMGRIGVRRSRA